MHDTTLALMLDQVRAIYRAATGSELPDLPPEGGDVSLEELARRFAELEALARTVPQVMQRVPPFSFSPALDVIDDHGEVRLELAVPGVDRGDVTVELDKGNVVVSGVRRGEPLANGHTYLHAEIARGPFHRVVRLPWRARVQPRVEIERGLIRIRIPKPGGPATA
jgi:HSP20 family molecular chaperone IbpA